MCILTIITNLKFILKNPNNPALSSMHFPKELIRATKPGLLKESLNKRWMIKYKCQVWPTPQYRENCCALLINSSESKEKERRCFENKHKCTSFVNGVHGLFNIKRYYGRKAFKCKPENIYHGKSITQSFIWNVKAVKLEWILSLPHPRLRSYFAPQYCFRRSRSRHFQNFRPVETSRILEKRGVINRKTYSFPKACHPFQAPQS